MHNLIGASHRKSRDDEDGESRIDYMSDRLAIEMSDVVRVVNLLREEKILADAKDLCAYIQQGKKTRVIKAFLISM
jgi:ATP-dependent DNA helicase RecQ